MNDSWYGADVSALPMLIHVPDPAGARWKRTLTTPESASLAVACSVIVPRRFVPGSTIVTFGRTSSTANDMRCASQRTDDESELALLPVDPAAAWVTLCDAARERSAVVPPEAASYRSVIPLGVPSSPPAADANAATTIESGFVVVIAAAVAGPATPVAAVLASVSTTADVFTP